jgi:predicted AlkP superfamily pyrophosphatase or phosphodiesterase
MRFKLLAALLAMSASATAYAQPSATPPKLIVVISIDQFSADLFDQYRPFFRGGIGRLARDGVTFANGYHVQAATETCPGHAAILTGAFPARTGIIANRWFDLDVDRPDKRIYCAEDERVSGTNSSRDNYRVSPFHLKAPTLSDLMAAQKTGGRSMAVAGKDRSAVMMTGHSAEQRWFWNYYANQFQTDNKTAVTPTSVAAANQLATKAIADGLPALTPPPECLARAKSIKLEPGNVTVGTSMQQRAPGDDSRFRSSPDFDGLTLALAARLIVESGLGRGAATDLVAVGISGVDYAGHRFGTDGPEVCLQLLSVDRDIGSFLDFLGSSGIDAMVVLTADHGGKDVPERARLGRDPMARRSDPAVYPTLLGERLKSELGLKIDGSLLYADAEGTNGAFNDVYVSKALSEADRKRLIDAAQSYYRQHRDIALVLRKDELLRYSGLPFPSDPRAFSLLDRARASFDKDRSGDLIVIFADHVMQISEPDPTYVATHGSAWDLDRRVPMIFWRKGITPANVSDAVRVADIMPTLAATIGVEIPAGSIDGHCLVAVAGSRCTQR